MHASNYKGLFSGKNVDKSGLFEIFYGKLTYAPMIQQCPLSMECKVIQTVDLPTNTFFTPEIVDIYTEDRLLSKGRPDVKKMNPFLLTIPDNRFWSIGKCVGKAWNVGKTIGERLKPK